MNIPLLSICIPTYNGGDYLIENLEALIPQIEKSSYDIELIISENGSSRDNYIKIRDYVSKISLKVDFTHHEKNIGGRANFAYAVSRANGKYVYLLGDDDVLAPNAIETICNIVALDKYSLIYFNFLAADANLQNAKLMTRQYNTSYEVFSFADFVSNKSFDLTFMSSLVFLNESWRIGIKKVKDMYYGYEWLASILFGTTQSEKPCMFYYYPLVLQRNPVKPWSKDYPIFKCVGQQSIYQDLDQYVGGLSIQKYIDNIVPYRPTLYAFVSKDPSYYQKYEEDLRKTLTPRDFKTLKRCLHSRIRNVYYLYYKCKQYSNLLKIGLNKIRKVI